MPEYVLSNTLQKPTWTNTTVLGGNCTPVLVGVRPAGDLISAVGAQAVFELSDLHRYESGVVVLTYRSRQADSSAA